MTIYAKSPGLCFSCGEQIEKGDPIDWFIDVDYARYWGHVDCTEISWEGAVRAQTGDTPGDREPGGLPSGGGQR